MVKPIKDMTLDEIFEKVASGEIESCECNSFTEYVKEMES